MDFRRSSLSSISESVAQELKSLSPSPNKSGDAFNFSFKTGFKK